MNDADRELLHELSRVNRTSGDFAVAVMENTISRDEQIAFAYRLVELAERIRDRAQQPPARLQSQLIL